MQVIKYCRTCGTKMTKRIYPVGQYNEDTGKREVVLNFKCPNERFWRFGHYNVVVATYTHLEGWNDINGRP